MNPMTTSPLLGRRGPGCVGDEILRDYRERLALDALERAALKQQDHAEQSSARNSADARIRVWEKVHQLRMPSAPLHPVLAVIAAVTQLTLSEVQYEQQLRSARRASAVI